MLLVLFRQCGIFCFLFVVGTVPIVWYFLFFYLLLVVFRQCGIFCFSIYCWYCSDSVVFFVFLFAVGSVLTLWYFLFFYLLLVLFWQCGIFCFSTCCWYCSDWYFLFFSLLDRYCNAIKFKLNEEIIIYFYLNNCIHLLCGFQ